MRLGSLSSGLIFPRMSNACQAFSRIYPLRLQIGEGGPSSEITLSESRKDEIMAMNSFHKVTICDTVHCSFSHGTSGSG